MEQLATLQRAFVIVMFSTLPSPELSPWWLLWATPSCCYEQRGTWCRSMEQKGNAGATTSSSAWSTAHSSFTTPSKLLRLRRASACRSCRSWWRSILPGPPVISGGLRTQLTFNSHHNSKKKLLHPSYCPPPVPVSS